MNIEDIREISSTFLNVLEQDLSDKSLFPRYLPVVVFCAVFIMVSIIMFMFGDGPIRSLSGGMISGGVLLIILGSLMTLDEKRRFQNEIVPQVEQFLQQCQLSRQDLYEAARMVLRSRSPLLAQLRQWSR